MSITICPTCGNTQTWRWEEAFDKFGFGDGDGLVMTDAVAAALRAAGYDVTVTAWGCHNVVISSVTRDGQELIPEKATLGYDDPRAYLPAGIVTLLDDIFTEDQEVQP